MKITARVKNFGALLTPIKELKLAVLVANTQLHADCVEGTPVDTGFARASWWVQANRQPAENPHPPTPQGKPKAGEEQGAAIPSPSANGGVLLNGVGALFSVVNSAKYIRRLEVDGHSQQNVGWCQRAAVAYPTNLKTALAKLKAKR